MPPQFLGIGPPRTGSTTLWACLRMHPDIEMPEAKELHWFDQPTWNPAQNKAYERNWRTNKVRGEISPDYCLYTDRIFQVYPDIKLIMTTREPVERFLSAMVLSYRRNAANTTSKDEYQKLVEDHVLRSVYHADTDHQLKLGQYSKMVQTVNPSQLLTISFDELSNDQTNTMVRIAEFLGVRPFRNIPYRHENPLLERFPFSDEFLTAINHYYDSI